MQAQTPQHHYRRPSRDRQHASASTAARPKRLTSPGLSPSPAALVRRAASRHRRISMLSQPLQAAPPLPPPPPLVPTPPPPLLVLAGSLLPLPKRSQHTSDGGVRRRRHRAARVGERAARARHAAARRRAGRLALRPGAALEPAGACAAAIGRLLTRSGPHGGGTHRAGAEREKERLPACVRACMPAGHPAACKAHVASGAWQPPSAEPS